MSGRCGKVSASTLRFTSHKHLRKASLTAKYELAYLPGKSYQAHRPSELSGFGLIHKSTKGAGQVRVMGD